jgi:hypothetical protein
MADFQGEWQDSRCRELLSPSANGRSDSEQRRKTVDVFQQLAIFSQIFEIFYFYIFDKFVKDHSINKTGCCHSGILPSDR